MNLNSRFAVAIHVCTLLAARPDGPLTSTCLARSVSTNPVCIRRIMALLRTAGLVSSQAGSGGGWRLAHPAAAITLRDIYEAVREGQPFALHPQAPNAACCVGRNIPGALRNVFAETEAVMTAHLQTVSLAHLLERVARPDPSD